jgi:hypothetical protein
MIHARDEHGREHPRTGLGAQDVVCRLKREGVPAWADKELTPASWRDCGHGVYQLALAPDEFENTDRLTILVEGSAELRPAILPELVPLSVVDAPPRGIPTVPQTILCGHVITLDMKGKHRAVVTARVAQLPHLVGGAAISNDPINAETDEQGYFQVTVPTGAIVAVAIPAINYQRQVVVPPAPASGIPVRLFTL